MSDLEELVAEAGRGQPVDPQRLVGVVARVRDILTRLDARLVPFEQRLLVVDDLPANAPFGALIRVRGQATLYLGNGPAQPLSRVVPQALP